MAASSSPGARSSSSDWRAKATSRCSRDWASVQRRRWRFMAVKAFDLTKDYKYGFSDPEQYSFKSNRGLNREVVEQISTYKSEPDWMRQFRLRALEIFLRKPLPAWPVARLSDIDFDNIYYYVRPTEKGAEKSWE